MLVFLFGLVSFVFQKLRGGNQSPGRRGHRMPPFGQGPGWGEMRMPGPARRGREGWPAPSAQPVATGEPAAPVEERESVPEPQLNAADSAAYMMPEVPHATPAPAPAADEQARSRLQPLSPASAFDRTGANSAVQGMMWAEVFGAPRSKKPYTTRR